MNILFTRPLIDAEDLMRKLFSMGHKIIHLPTLKISSTNMKPIDPNNFDAFIFTSANSIRNLKISKQKKIICFCVGIMTEKIARQTGFNETLSAGGTVNALKNLIINSNKIDKQSNIAYFCGDNISSDLEKDLKKEGLKVKKIINYTSEKIVDLSNENKEMIKKYPPDLVFIYSIRSAESFIKIIKNYSLYPLMTGSTVMCISKKVAKVFELEGWKKIETFNPGEELLKLNN
tara:strand:+ start:5802 stop:6497 length:696 start_codon:yes stop_codon:yes gene_type:complete